MAPPRIEKIITALDVGSWKVCALIAGQTADGALHVLGTAGVLDVLDPQVVVGPQRLPHGIGDRTGGDDADRDADPAADAEPASRRRRDHDRRAMDD